ncbi:uncharacterized protein LOC142350970 [Convolutriloba macropyga]|uniref:uncharacterized protein LOC142350970 n=1 Tax=Convolutriloba macropyga TaxID=536237 RepID=UPI003F525915
MQLSEKARYCYLVKCDEAFCPWGVLEDKEPKITLNPTLIADSGSAVIYHEVYIPGYQFLVKGTDLRTKRTGYDSINKNVSREMGQNEEYLQQRASKTSWWKT